MTEHVRIPVRLVNGQRWGNISVFGANHEFVAEKVKEKNPDYTFAGGHRVRLYSFKKAVHWRLPAGLEVDISDVPPAYGPARRRRG